MDKITRWLNERIGLEGIKEIAYHKKVPLHRHSIWYYFGGMTLFLFSIQIVTGILLLFYYQPGEQTSYESVQHIVSDVPFGWLIRSLHSWSANLMVATAFLHMFSVFFLRAYRRPREVTWLTGVVLLILTMTFGFSGYLLPWNELSYFATRVGTEIPGVVPVVGKFILHFLRNGEDVTGATINRFFAIHIWVLPLFAMGLLGIHLLLVQKHGMSVPEKFENQKLKEIPFVPNFLLRDLLGWLFILCVLMILCTLFPWELGFKADMLKPAPPGIKPEWYFLFMFETLKLIPSKILLFDGEVLGVLAFGGGAFLLMLVPFLDVSQRAKLWTRRIGVLVILYMAYFTITGILK